MQIAAQILHWYTLLFCLKVGKFLEHSGARSAVGLEVHPVALLALGGQRSAGQGMTRASTRGS